MRKVFWLFVFFALYVWLLNSGNDRLVIEQGRAFYQALVSWFDDAEVDFQIKQKNKLKKKSRRWD